ncbi:MAG TPA: ATP-binding protein, partial [bacterium]|nr:ATP-binding protein [bacterium]
TVASRVAEMRAALSDARDGARRVRDIVRDLKTFSRQDNDARHSLQVRAVLESAIAMTWNEIRHRALLVRELDTVPAVRANEARLGQVFLNLLLNAAQAIPEGRARSHRIVVRTFMEGGNVVIEVEDSGAGIPPDVLPRIFDPFFTTKPVGQGSGLGLSICRGIVAAVGGTLDVRSEVGRGTTARVVLPPDTAAEVAAPAPVAPTAERTRGRVLVVDDEPLIVLAVRRALGPDVDVVHAGGGRDALARIAEDGAFDAIVCDLMMPEVDGIEFFERTREQKPGLEKRIVFLTGGAFTPRAREFVARDGLTVVEKPFDAEQLRAVVRARMAVNAPG